MRDILTKKALNQSLDIISELNLDEEDCENIFAKFDNVLNAPEIKAKLQKVLENKNSIKEMDINSLMTFLVSNLQFDDLKLLLENVIKNESLVDFIQDLFIEKIV